MLFVLADDEIFVGVRQPTGENQPPKQVWRRLGHSLWQNRLREFSGLFIVSQERLTGLLSERNRGQLALAESASVFKNFHGLEVCDIEAVGHDPLLLVLSPQSLHQFLFFRNVI